MRESYMKNVWALARALPQDALARGRAAVETAIIDKIMLFLGSADKTANFLRA